MALIPGTNTFATLTEANNILTEIFGTDDWFTYSLSDREKLLTSAFYWLVSEGASKSATSDSIKVGQSRLALWIYKYIAEHEERQALYAGGVRSFTLSKWSERLEASGLPEFVKKIVADDIGLGGYLPVWERELEN